MPSIDLNALGLVATLRQIDLIELNGFAAGWDNAAQADFAIGLIWKNADGVQLGNRVELTPTPPIALEKPGGGGTVVQTLVAMPHQFSGPVPPGWDSRTLLYRGLEIPLIEVATGARYERYGQLPDYQTGAIGADNALVTLHLFAERFTLQSKFVDRVAEFHAALTSMPPFDAHEVQQRIRVAWHFAPTDPLTGIFNTPDSVAEKVPIDANNPQGPSEGRMFHGDLAISQQLTQAYTAASARGIILIDSEIGGGAGGTDQQYLGQTLFYPAWASIKARSGEEWWQVAVHELGHAIGLGDEYSAAHSDPNYRPPGPTELLEPNISRTQELNALPWPTSVPAEHFADWRTTPGIGNSRDTIAAFQGALYSETDFFRPTMDCAMRTTTQPFCPVCQRAIRTKLNLPV